VAAEEGSMESEWTELPQELPTKVLEVLQAADSVRLTPEAGVGARPHRWCGG
jgi:hypothetical protein